MSLFSTDWIKKAEELKVQRDLAWRKVKTATTKERGQAKKEYEKISNAYDEAVGKALKQKADQRKKPK